MPSDSKGDMIENFVGEYTKKGLFSIKYDVKLIVYKEHIEGVGFNLIKKEISREPRGFYIDLNLVNNLTTTSFDGTNMLRIDYQSEFEKFNVSSIIIPNIDCARAIEIVKEAKGNVIDEQNRKIEEQNRKVEELNKKNIETIIIQMKKNEESSIQWDQKKKARKDFFDKCYEFHISDKQRPYFELDRTDLQLSTIYVDERKNLNFLRIDGWSQEESNGIIPFAKIHYYEKAGNVHYLTSIDGKYSSFGGSMAGGTFSKKAAFWGGLLFGPMGMAAGALFSHQPAQMTMPTTSFEIESKEVKIDDRNVLLNYYSDKHKQFIDIELPAEIYNFLQTHIPEKKYGIVLELEKQTAVIQAKQQIENGDYLKIPQTNNVNLVEEKSDNAKQENDLITFKKKIEKIKIMHEAGLLTDEEFDEEKNKILKSL